MSLKRTWIGVRYWLTKRWRMLYCCIALACFALILITSKNENINSSQLTNAKRPTVQLRHSLTASGEQSTSSIKQLSSKNENSSIAERLNNMIRKSWSTINDYYTSYYTNYIIKAEPEIESSLITLFSSTKFQKFNEIDFDTDRPVLQMNVSDELKAQLDLVVRRVIEYHENTFNIVGEQRIDKNSLTINLIEEILKRQNENGRPLTISYTDQWQPVIGPKEKSRVYSAFYESRLEIGKLVRIIGAAQTNNAEPLYCALWFIEDGKLKLLMTPAINRAIRENWNLRYSAYYLLCPLGNHTVPVAVSILKKKLPAKKTNQEANEVQLRPEEDEKEADEFVFHALGNFVLVQNNLKSKHNDKIAVCVKPLHYEYNKLDNMIEFIELNRILGVDHFLFYNHTVGPKVDCLLNRFVKETNLVTVLGWQNLDMKTQDEIRTEGIFASLNDCLYRTMYKFKYVLMIDLDEFIVPHLDDNLKVLLDRLTNYSVSKDRVGAFSFQNGFFYLQWFDDRAYSKLTKSNDDRLPVYLTTLAKTRRRATLHNHRERSKLIVKPEAVVEVGNHFVSIFKLLCKVNLLLKKRVNLY